MSDRVIYICPLCTKTFRSKDDFTTHIAHKINVLETVLKNPELRSKVVSNG